MCTCAHFAHMTVCTYISHTDQFLFPSFNLNSRQNATEFRKLFVIHAMFHDHDDVTLDFESTWGSSLKRNFSRFSQPLCYRTLQHAASDYTKLDTQILAIHHIKS